MEINAGNVVKLHSLLQDLTLRYQCSSYRELTNSLLEFSSFQFTWPRGYKTFFMLNSTEHEIFPAHKC